MSRDEKRKKVYVAPEMDKEEYTVEDICFSSNFGTGVYEDGGEV